MGTLLFFCVIGIVREAPSATGASLAGTWPWKGFDLVVVVDGPRLTLTRKLAWGRREVEDLMCSSN